MTLRFGGRTRPLRFAQFRSSSSTTWLSTLALRGVAVTKTLRNTSPFHLTKLKTKTPKNKTKKTKTKKTKKTKTTFFQSSSRMALEISTDGRVLK